MNTKRWLVIACSLIIGLYLFFPVEVNYASDQGEGVVESFSGDVSYLRGPWWKFWGWEEVSEGQKLLANDYLRVGHDSTLDIQLSDGSSIRILEDTTLVIEESGYVTDDDGQLILTPSVKIKQGEIWLKVEKVFSNVLKFKVKTPNAVAGVRGTVFSVLVKNHTSAVQVEEGLVEVTQTKSGESVHVQGGYQTEVVGQKAPQDPMVLEQEKRDKLKTWVLEVKKHKAKIKQNQPSDNSKNKDTEKDKKDVDAKKKADHDDDKGQKDGKKDKDKNNSLTSDDSDSSNSENPEYQNKDNSTDGNSDQGEHKDDSNHQGNNGKEEDD